MEKNKTATRKKLKAQLQWGDIPKIAKIAGVGRSTVIRWFDGSTDAPAVPEAVNKLLTDRSEKINSRLNDFA